MTKTRISNSRANSKSKRRPWQARNIFISDIDRINRFLEEMQDRVKSRCESEKIPYPKAGRGHVGFHPNFPFATSCMLKGLNTVQAADEYFKELQTGGNVYA